MPSRADEGGFINLTNSSTLTLALSRRRERGFCRLFINGKII